MKRYDLIIVGAGPSGLSAAIEAGKKGLNAVVFDENARPGGQLFKQVHKFFGSKEHKAKIRGFQIGQDLLAEAEALGVEVILNATVTGLFQDKEITVKIADEICHYKADAIIVATGAAENTVPFEGWTLPGVMGAGAAQTLMNLHGIKPGNKILMLGSGNVGLVVGYQLLQAGCELVALVDASPKIGGYGVHAAKLARTGVPFFLSHTIVRAQGTDHVTGVEIAQVDKNWNIIPESKKYFEVDTICMAVGLSPMAQLMNMAGAKMETNPQKGGCVPLSDSYGKTSLEGVFVAGDVAGVEEASSAMIEGHIAGVSAAAYLGFVGEEEQITRYKDLENSLYKLRQGMFSLENRGKIPSKTEEGCATATNLLYQGFCTEEEVQRFPGVTKQAGVHAVIECLQNIPCNPCQEACGRHCIKIGEKITSLPSIDEEKTCSGCGMCVASCSGQAIFLVDESYADGYASVTMPYEFLPLPQVGAKGWALDRSGEAVCKTEVVQVKTSPVFDHTNLLTIKVPVDKAMSARFFKGGVLHAIHK